MPKRWLLSLLSISIICSSLTLSASGQLSDRVVAYKIDARYDAKAHSLDATETLTYTNKTGKALDRFPFHLYLNAFQPKASWIREAHRAGQRDFGADGGWNQKSFGSDTIKSLEVVGMGDLTKQMRFISPDDNNPDDRTVFEVQLPRPIAPGETVQFKIAFHDQFPEVVARTGYKRDFLLAGQWFPKVGVWWNGAWNCHQFHAATEFFADYGTFDVSITLPDNFNFGSTGVVTQERRNGDGTKTITTHAEDVHDFAWTADPTTKIVEDDVQLPSGRKHIRMLMQPGHMSSTERYMQALKGTMLKFEQWYGPYPYPQITVVDPPHGGSAAGGMEYPTFITADTNWWMPKSLLMPELVVEHEYGHQYWYGMVGSNEFENAWLDEGINSFTEVKIMDALYGRNSSVLNSRIGTAGERGLQRMQYSTVTDYDPLSRNAWEYQSYNSYGGVTYGKTATMLITLEKLVGEEKLRNAIHTYFMRYRFKHPTEDDFFNTMNEALGQNLGWYWDQAVRGTQKFDYRVLPIQSTRTDWFEKKPADEKKGVTEYQSWVTVHRKGDFIFPVTLEVKFYNGEKVREQWDGKDRWHRWSFVRKAKVVSAEIDPDHALTMDIQQYNNSYVEKKNGAATNKIGMYWMLVTQFIAHLLAWLA